MRRWGIMNMKLLMHILAKNYNLDIDNSTLSSKEIINKTKEEFNEVVEAIEIYETDKSLVNLKQIIRETFDLIQMCILILWRCHRRALTFDELNLIQELNIEHKDKLISERQWMIKTGIEIDVKE
jgi:NTP pyrophosphatase (non-canonical NTP hydrolase)